MKGDETPGLFRCHAGVILPTAASLAAFRAGAGDGWCYDPVRAVLWIRRTAAAGAADTITVSLPTNSP